jgi:hypothetical protein
MMLDFDGAKGDGCTAQTAVKQEKLCDDEEKVTGGGVEGCPGSVGAGTHVGLGAGAAVAAGGAGADGVKNGTANNPILVE